MTNRLQTERLPDGRRELLRDLYVNADGGAWVVKKGETTDYSTIPWFGRWVVRWSRVDLAGVVHDRAYRTHDVSRWRADRIWRKIAQAGEHHANWAQAWICWAALRVAGWIAWRKSNVPS